MVARGARVLGEVSGGQNSSKQQQGGASRGVEREKRKMGVCVCVFTWLGLKINT